MTCTYWPGFTNVVPSPTAIFNETHEPDGHAWKLLSTVPSDQTGSGPHPMNSRVVPHPALRRRGAGGDGGSATAADLERAGEWENDDEEKEGAKPVASRKARRPARRDWTLMVLA